jgi:hypothetical protein
MPHRAEPVADLKPLQKVGERLVVQRRSKPGFAAGVAPVALLHERNLSGCGLARQFRFRPERRPAPGRAACHAGEDDDSAAARKRRGTDHLPLRRTRQSTPVRSCGAGPRVPMVITPKSTMDSAVPLGSNRAATGRSRPPGLRRDAGPLVLQAQSPVESYFIAG